MSLAADCFVARMAIDARCLNPHHFKPKETSGEQQESAFERRPDTHTTGRAGLPAPCMDQVRTGVS